MRWSRFAFAVVIGLAMGAPILPGSAQVNAQPVLAAGEKWPLRVTGETRFDAPRLRAALDTLAVLNGITRDRFRVDPAALALEGEYPGRLPLHRYVMAEPLRAPAAFEAWGRHLAIPFVRCSDLLLEAGRWTSPEFLPGAQYVPPVSTSVDSVLGALRGRVGDAGPRWIEGAMENLYRGTGRRFQGRTREGVLRDASLLSSDACLALSRMILAAANATAARDHVLAQSELGGGGFLNARSRETSAAVRDRLAADWGSVHLAPHEADDLQRAMDHTDLRALIRGAAILARELERATFSTDSTAADFQFEWTTPLGRIGIGGGGDNSFRGRFLIVYDLGGDDRYEGAGVASVSQGVSIIVDAGGNDRYAPADSLSPAPGGAILGYAAVLDLGDGRDEYTGEAWGAGFGFLGVGWVVDKGGDDRYEHRESSQGSAAYGVGLVLEEGGDDQYTLSGDAGRQTVGRGQGFGGPRGAGMIVDLGGNDSYTSSGSGIGARGGARECLGPAAARGTQGAAAGGWGLAGGVGLLVDVAGQDTYQGEIWGLGFGGLGALGVLIDVAGNDRYSGVGLVEGAAYSSGAGLLVDGGGDDLYEVQPGGGMGLGVALGLGILAESSGDDEYRMCGDGLGSSRAAGGGGVFLDCGGKDRYTTFPETGFAVGEVSPYVPFLGAVPGLALAVDLENDITGFGELMERLAAAPPLGPTAAPVGQCFGGGYFGGHGVLRVHESKTWRSMQ